MISNLYQNLPGSGPPYRAVILEDIGSVGKDEGVAQTTLDETQHELGFDVSASSSDLPFFFLFPT